MRNALYKQLQDLPVSFHDRWPSGQLLSRMLSDLNLIRRWISFGIVLFIVNIITILVGFVFLLQHHVDARRHLHGLLDPALDLRLPVREEVLRGRSPQPGPGRRPRDRRRGVGARHPRAQGVRSRQARARRTSRARPRSFAAPRSRRRRRSRASGSGCCWCPTSPSRSACSAACWLAVNGQITLGELVAFFATATVLRWPVESIGFLLSMTFDTRTAADRFFEVMDEDEHHRRPRAPEDDRRPAGATRVRGRALPLPGLARAVPDLHRRRRPRPSSRARPWRSSA